MCLSSKYLVRYFWMMLSTKSHSRIRFSDCLSFSKDLTWRQKRLTLPQQTATEKLHLEAVLFCFFYKMFPRPTWNDCKLDFWCQQSAKWNWKTLHNSWLHCQAHLPSHSFPPCQRPGPCSWCRLACSAPAESPETKHTHNDKRLSYDSTINIDSLLDFLLHRLDDDLCLFFHISLLGLEEAGQGAVAGFAERRLFTEFMTTAECWKFNSFLKELRLQFVDVKLEFKHQNLSQRRTWFLTEADEGIVDMSLSQNTKVGNL